MAYQAQAVDSTEPISDDGWEISANSTKYGVVWGCDVTFDGSNMTYDVAAGGIMHNGLYVAVAAQANAGTLVADSSHPRFVWIYLASAGAEGMPSGTAAADPAVPALGDNVSLYLVLVQANLSVANSATAKIDKRIPFMDQRQLSMSTHGHRKVLVDAAFNEDQTFSNADIMGGFGVVTIANSASINTATGDPTGGAIEFDTNNTGNADVGVRTHGTPAEAQMSPYFTTTAIMATANSGIEVQAFGFNSDSAIGNWDATDNYCAMVRGITTGAAFFVTGNGSSEETTSLASFITLGSTDARFEIYTFDAGVTWICRIDGVVRATHTSTVPSVSEPMYVMFGIANNTTSAHIINNVRYIYADQDMP